MSSPVSPDARDTPAAVFLRGVAAAWRSIFAYVLFGTYIGLGALAHDFGFSPGWMVFSTVLIWAAPAQIILISTLGTASLAEVAVAVGLSSIRFFPMVVALLPMLRTAETRMRHLVLPAHLTAISAWVEAMRLLPSLPRDQRIAFFNGLASGLIASAAAAGVVGYYMAAKVPTLFAAALLFLTPLSMLLSTTRNSRDLVDRLALALGLVIGPILAHMKVGLDLMWTGIVGGTIAYLVHRLREATR